MRLVVVASNHEMTCFFIRFAEDELSDDFGEDDIEEEGSSYPSVTGPIYEMDGVPNVKLFTKHGCTLCDKVKDVRLDECAEMSRMDI